MPKITFDTYKSVIRDRYLEIQKDESHELNRFFKEIRPGRIKDATRTVYRNRIENSISSIEILAFFFHESKNKDFEKYLKNVNADKYIPVKQFLEGETQKPREEVIEFSAWLLDFQPRPYSEYRNKGGEIDDVITPPPPPPNGTGSRKNKKWKIVITISIIFPLFAIIYFGLNSRQKGCMIWKQDQYELANCPKNYNPKIIPIDEELLKEFKKIEVDTNFVFFDDNGNAKVWYDKTGGRIEFFTSEGRHPTNNKVLKPITQAIVRKYVFGEE